MRRLLKQVGVSLCNFGLWVLTLGPLDDEDREMRAKLLKARDGLTHG